MVWRRMAGKDTWRGLDESTTGGAVEYQDPRFFGAPDSDDLIHRRQPPRIIFRHQLLTPPPIPPGAIAGRPLHRGRVDPQVHDAPSDRPARAAAAAADDDEGILPAPPVLLVLDVHLVHVPPVLLVLVLVVRAEDGGGEPDDGAESQGGAVEEFPFGLGALVGGFGEVGVPGL